MFRQLNTNELIQFLYKHRPDLIEDMNKADHNYDKDNLSPYHMEGSVMTHLMMVMNEADRLNISPLAKVMALVHDLGKPLSLFVNHEKKRNFFMGHEGLSCFVMIDLLKKLGLSQKEIELCIFVVSHHTYLYQFFKNESLDKSSIKSICNHFKSNVTAFEYMLELAEADNNGRISNNKRSNFALFFDEVKKELLIDEKLEKDKKYEFDHEVEILIGPQGSGKSSYADQKKKEGFIILCRDDIAEEHFQKPYSELTNIQVFDEKVDKIFNQKLLAYLKNKQSFIIDKTNMTNKSQLRNFGNADKNTCFKKATVFIKDYELLKKHLKKREERTGKTIQLDQVHKTLKNFQAPIYSVFHDIEYKIFD